MVALGVPLCGARSSLNSAVLMVAMAAVAVVFMRLLIETLIP